ncbi:MAG TPA: hypothetical protein VN449_00085 [Gaiellaceae bacterium]|nr:hypothetical protein [Gaiellaceae bacterium]
MPEESLTKEYVAECFWPGVDEAAVRALDARAGESAAELVRSGHSVRYLGSILMHEDEVVLCLFAGDEGVVRRAAAQAGVPFERILEASGSPWPIPKPG